MPAYAVRCSTCSTQSERFKTFAQQKDGDAVEKDPCECGGAVEIVITECNIGSDALPTRGYGRAHNAPAIEGINVGKDGVRAHHLGLTKDQCQRLGI